MSSHSSFNIFGDLPLEIRNRVWFYVILSEPQLIEVYNLQSINQFTGDKAEIARFRMMSIPTALHICRESRAEALRLFQVNGGLFSVELQHGPENVRNWMINHPNECPNRFAIPGVTFEWGPDLRVWNLPSGTQPAQVRQQYPQLDGVRESHIIHNLVLDQHGHRHPFWTHFQLGHVEETLRQGLPTPGVTLLPPTPTPQTLQVFSEIRFLSEARRHIMFNVAELQPLHTYQLVEMNEDTQAYSLQTDFRDFLDVDGISDSDDSEDEESSEDEDEYYSADENYN